MAEESEKIEKKSFWETVPGILTGVAAVITALTGLLALFISSDHNKKQSSDPVVQEKVIPVTHHKSIKSEREPVAEQIDISGIWNDPTLGTQVRIQQNGSQVSSETYYPSTGQRLAVGSGVISGQTIEGSYQWYDGNRYTAILRLSADGHEISGMYRNVLTGESGTTRLIR